eukprot:TRINITY_DN24195_c0_g1_i1.p1 TRINITY_DN24195_c0_g1~~TRINITY_DN24195_c0_g1_i1.p1  ORF type:complete len:253 (-),score=106.84 TRINITY_DN24195_c0_g1_i1:125-856(-)
MMRYMVECSVTTVGSAINWAHSQSNLFPFLSPSYNSNSNSNNNSNNNNNNNNDNNEEDENEDNGGGVMFVPGLAGLGEPWNDEKARGMFIGIGLDTTKSQLERAVLEGIGLSMYDLIQIIKQRDPELYYLMNLVKQGEQQQQEQQKNKRRIRVNGGVSRNDDFCRMWSDVLGRGVERHEDCDLATARGVVMMAGLGAGVWSGLEELRQLRRVEKTWDGTKTREWRREKRRKWRNAVSRSLDWK